ncbi:MAG: PAS domain S-box protein [Polyangiaceae bacterium]
MIQTPAPNPAPSPPGEECFRHIVESLEDCGIFTLDALGYIKSWNAGAQRLLGYPGVEIVGKHVSLLYPAESLARGACAIALQVAEHDGSASDEGWRLRQNGSKLWVTVELSALRDDAGKPAGFAAVLRDLSAREPGGDALRLSEERFRLLVDNCKDYAIFMLDVRGHVTTWNLGAERIKGYAAHEVLGRHFSLFYPDSDVRAGKCERELELALKEGRVEDEGWRVRNDGSHFWASVVLSAVHSREGRLVGFAKVTRDLTEHKKAEGARLRLVEMQQTNRLKDEFLATISHELRTPLHAILGWANLLRERVQGAEVVKAADTILRNAEAQAHIIDDMLDVSRIVTGKFKLELKTADLCALVRESLDVVRPSAAARQVKLSFEHDDRTFQLIADPTRLSQVIWNLLSNAVKFTDPGGSVVLRLSQRGALIELDVRDTGRGIDAEFLPYVFDRFRQAEGSAKRRFGGLGLGLAIVREIVELHGGETWAESDGLGTGSAFHVRLPVRAARPASDEERTSPRTIRELILPSVRLDGLRVLVVDDERDARELLAELLEGRGAESFSADCAEEARRAIAIARPHVIISDIAMPEEDGYDFIRSVRALATQQGGTTPAIALTAHARRDDRVRALGAGFTSYVQKPVDVEELIRLVQNLGRPQPETPPPD